MTQRVAAVFPSREAAERGADALESLGADRSHVSMLARGDETRGQSAGRGAHDDDGFVEPAREVGDSGAALTTTDAGDVASGATLGAVAGLAAGLLSLVVPGIGLVLAAGPLAAAAAGGAIAGGVYGGLRDIGVEEQHARHYEERLRGGGVLMTALVPDMDQQRVLEVLAEHGAEDVSFARDTSAAPASPVAAAGTADLTTRAASRTAATTDEIRVPVTEETLEVRKEQREVGKVAVRKDVEVETQRITEPVTRTRVEVERRAVPTDRAAVYDADASALREGDEIRVPVVEEELVVQKVPRVTEEVVIRKETETEQVERDVELRHERVDVEEEGEAEIQTTGAASRSSTDAPTRRRH